MNIGLDGLLHVTATTGYVLTSAFLDIVSCFNDPLTSVVILSCFCSNSNSA